MFLKTFKGSSVSCEESETVSMYNKQFGQLDPHLQFDDTQDDPQASAQQMQQGPRQNPRLPPSFDSMLNNIKAVTQKVEHINGFKFQFNIPLSPVFNVMSTWSIPDKKPEAAAGPEGENPNKQQDVSNFGLALQYVDGQIEDLMRGSEPNYVLTGRWNSTGFLEGAIIQKLSEGVTLRYTSHKAGFMKPSDTQAMLDLDVEGDDWNSSFRLGTGQISANLMQTIGNNWVLGFETMYLLERRMTLLSYAARYNKQKHHLFAQYVAPIDSLTLAYSMQIQPRAHLISEFNISPTTLETGCVLGYRQKFSSAEVISTVHSKGKISSVLNLQTPGQPHSLKLCAVADLVKDSFKFGYGLFMGNQ